MKKIIFLIFSIFITNIEKINTQTFQWCRYGNGTFNNFGYAVASDVTSDYGTRNPGATGTLFHRGVDICPYGNQDVVLVAPFNGMIEDIIRSTDRLIAIRIRKNMPIPFSPKRFSFLHIFNNNDLPIIQNGFRLEEINLNLVIIDMVNCRAFSKPAGLQVTCNGQTITTTNIFQEGWPLAPMGTSGNHPSYYDYHVHITQHEIGNTWNIFQETFLDLTASMMPN